ncbi:MAG: laccase domain-containing protein [Candidatus Levybacteria bacterium]|nr:laccase domain-containing protein [Candidatus Levybacteria bacterium]MBI4098025.1 laccase domain-containing protein [Candidatus Levybacteria bacterium]
MIFDIKDAIWTKRKRIPLVVKPADCPAAILYGKTEEDEDIIGMVHASWHTADIGLPYELIVHLLKQGVKADSIRAAVSPGIFMPYFSTDYDNIKYPKNWYGNARLTVMPDRSKRLNLDIAGAMVSQLIQAGVNPLNIEIHRLNSYTEAIKGNAFSNQLENDQASQGIENVRRGRHLVAAMLV